jgi:hypothetical protein
MRHITIVTPGIRKIVAGALLAAGLLIVGSAPTSAQDHMKPEIIMGVITGTGTQVGQITNFRLAIYELSNPEDKQILADAFTKGQNQGLFNALGKMRAVGRVAISGTLGFDVSYIRIFPIPGGRRVRFVTNRKITFGEAWTDSRSQSFDLTGGEIDLNDTDRKKSTGVIYPAAQLIIDKEGQLQIELANNPWKLVDISDHKGTPGEN